MDETVFLSLLLAEAPADAFEAPVRQALGRGAPDEEIERLREAARQALQLRTVLSDRRRRERELAALYETAGDLSSLRDVEQVLQAIVRRARQLLGTDTAYLTLIDEERDDTYMRVTEGVVDDSFRDLRLPLGKGLGGLVAETARPYFTADYLSDPQFDHTDYIDAAVVAERITAIIGVPLMLGDRVIGVLFAANRHERREFSPDEVNLLSSLAAHAAIAIENARLFQDAQEALAELNASNEVVRAHSEAVERAAAAHERFTNLVLQGGDIHDVARAVAEVLGGDLWVVDPDGRVLSPSAASSPEPPDLGEALASGRTHGRTTVLPSGHGWVTPVFAGNELLGSLVLRTEEQLDAADLRTLERAAQVTALLILNQRSLAEAEHRMRGELVDDLLSHPERDGDGLRRRARLVGVDLDAPHVVVVAAAPDAVRRHLQAAAAALPARCGGVASAYRGTAVVLVPGDHADTVAGHVAKILREMLGGAVTVGASGPASGAAALVSAYEEADRCRRVLSALGRHDAVATAADLGPYALYFSEAGRSDLERFVDHTLGPVLAYDRDRGTELEATLCAYFAAEGNLTRTAETLHVHVNTLYQRLERIRALLGRDLRDAETSLQLHLALRLRELAAAL